MRNIILSFLFFNLFIAFEAFSQTSDDYEKTFKYGTPSQKIAAISKIKRTKNEADIAMIANHYPEEMNSGVKSEIINFFKQNKNDNAKIIIEYAIEDENESVRKDAYYLCSIYPDIQYEIPIMNEITNASGLVLDSMINALGSIKSETAADFLLEKYADNTAASSTKVEILRYFSETKNPKGEAICRNAAQNAGESALVRYMGVVALGAYPSIENYKILQKLLAEDLPEITARVIYILPEYEAYGDVKKDIVEAAKNDSDSVRIYAIKALNNYKSEPEIEELLLYRLKNDNSEAITIEILNLYKDSPSAGNMYEAIKTLADSSASDKIKNLAKSVIGRESKTIDESLTGIKNTSEN
ncbi:HEAT repeat domain-containing protein [uncultured Brachyspira sp.]|uniref:HEAT repeat domain-containing protein n=1 Tax=uncultured Brachyspira sp. TaxID=221953 RepID=UPI0025DF4538|nr:HEAT repeat domain-containing protein [uncultured Brachyspira sp.]